MSVKIGDIVIAGNDEGVVTAIRNNGNIVYVRHYFHKKGFKYHISQVKVINK